jgi:hypothetical protein
MPASSKRGYHALKTVPGSAKSLLRLLSLDKSFPRAAAGIICPGEVIQGIFTNEPGIVDFIRGEITLAAKPFYRLRVDLETAGSFQDTEVIIQYWHIFSNHTYVMPV